MSSTAAPTSRHTTPEAIDGQEDDLGLQLAPAPSLMALVPRSGRSAPVRVRDSLSLRLLDEYEDSPPLSPVLAAFQPTSELAVSPPGIAQSLGTSLFIIQLTAGTNHIKLLPRPCLPVFSFLPAYLMQSHRIKSRRPLSRALTRNPFSTRKVSYYPCSSQA